MIIRLKKRSLIKILFHPKNLKIWLLLFIYAMAIAIPGAPHFSKRRIVFEPPPDKSGDRKKPVTLVSKQIERAVFDAGIPYCVLTDVLLEDGGEYISLELPHVTIPNSIGHPESPFREVLIRIAPGSKLALKIDDIKWFEIDDDINLAPVQPPLTDHCAPSGESRGKMPSFHKDQEAYSAGDFEDRPPVRLQDTVRIRGREYARIIYAPAFYNPSQKRLRIAYHVRFHLDVSLPGYVKSRRPGVLGAVHLPDSLDIRMTEKMEIEENPSASFPQPETCASASDADYLIISPDAFADEVQTLADWKHRKGYRTYLATLTEVGGSTESDINTYIQNAYDAGVQTSFVLLVGDHENLPGAQIDYHPSCYGSNVPFYSDLPYACVDGSDYYPDLTIGRLPGDSESQITTLVNKTLSYDCTPNSSNRYDHALFAGMFQDDEDHEYTANRWFMEGLHHAADFLGPDYDYFATEISKSYTIHTAFQWVTDHDNSGVVFDPTIPTLHYRSSGFPGRLTPPDPVPASWKAFGNNNKTAIDSAVNTGVGLVFHRDHGYASYDGQWYDGLGWGDPDYRTADVNNLTNGTKLPFVFSLNCGTGHWEDRDAFAEAWMRNSSGGAVGFTGAARVSYSGCNDAFFVGLMDTIWDDYSGTPNAYGAVTPYPLSFRPAHALNRARAFVMATYGSGDESYGTLTARLFSWFGDPELALRTRTPLGLNAAHPTEITAGLPADFDVTVTRSGSPLEGALVALVLDPGDYHTDTTNASGVAHFSFTPAGGGSMMVTASEHDSIPYQGAITVNVVSLYTLTYTAGEHGSITGDTVQTVAHGSDGTEVEAVPVAGYHFVKWSDDSTVNPRTDANVTGDISVSASFAINHYTVQFQTDGTGGASLDGATSQTIAHGDDCTTVTAVPPAIHHFEKWTKGGADYSTDNPLWVTDVTEAMVLTAHFAINTYTLTYTAGAGGSISGDTPQTVDHGSGGTEVEAVPVAGYHFVKWSDDSTVNPRTDTNVTGDISVSASFAINTYTLTYYGGSSAIIMGASPQTVNHGSNGTPVEAVPDTGYHFVQWSDGSTDNPRTDLNVSYNITVTAYCEINQYTVTFTTDGTPGASLNGATEQTVYHGVDATGVKAVPPADFRFVKWMKDGSDYSTDNPLHILNVTGDMNLVAIFARRPETSARNWEQYE